MAEAGLDTHHTWKRGFRRVAIEGILAWSPEFGEGQGHERHGKTRGVRRNRGLGSGTASAIGGGRGAVAEPAQVMHPPWPLRMLRELRVDHPLFTDSALQADHDASQGVARRLNAWAQTYLLAAYAAQSPLVDDSVVAVAIHERQ